MSRRVPFHKMSGAGNDFLMLGPEGFAAIGSEPREWIRRVCRRRLSVGADGVLVVEPRSPGVVSVRFFNPDGSEAFCGNGSRCAARYALYRGFSGPRVRLQTAAGDVEAVVGEGRCATVELTLPAPRRVASVDLGELDADQIDAGSPHVVAGVEDAARFDLAGWGPRVSRDPRFGEGGTNFSVLSRGEGGAWDLRTWERGVDGETLACGSGAVAAALVARLAGAPERVQLIPTGGVPLEVDLPGPADAPREARLRGDARLIVVGEVEDEATCGF